MSVGLSRCTSACSGAIAGFPSTWANHAKSCVDYPTTVGVEVRRYGSERPNGGVTEGDLIVGKDSGSAIETLVERMTGFVMLLHLPDNHGADAVQEAMVVAMSQLPAVLKKTLTWDQGKEMSDHVQIAAATDLDIYFCDPHSPWTTHPGNAAPTRTL